MTTVAAYQHDGDVEWGWDSLMVTGNEQGVLLQPKVFAKNGAVYGIGGVALAINLIQYAEDWPSYEGGDPQAWIINTLRPALQKIGLNEPHMDNEEHDHPEWQLLLSVAGIAFEFDSAFNPARLAEGIYTLGSGGDYAKGALYAGAPMMDAMAAASDIDPYTGGPLYVSYSSKLIENQKNFEIKNSDVAKKPKKDKT